MRSVMISMTIIVFCLSMQVLNTVDADFISQNNRSLFGWKGQPYMNESNIPSAGTETDAGDKMENMMGVASNPPDSPLDTMWGLFTYLVGAITFLIDLLFKSTIGFGKFLQTMGGNDVEIVPSYLANTIMVLVNINHLLAISQLLGKFNLKGGA